MCVGVCGVGEDEVREVEKRKYYSDKSRLKEAAAEMFLKIFIFKFKTKKVKLSGKKMERGRQ